MAASDAERPLCTETALKWASLGSLVLHSVVIVLCFRFSQLQPPVGPRYSTLTVVVSSELLKLAVSLALMGLDPGGLATSVRRMCWTDARATLAVGVPGVLYATQNYLFFVALANLSVGLYKGSKQLAIPFTAVLRVAVFRRRIPAEKWVALLAVAGGVALLTSGGDATAQGDLHVGLAAVVIACALSALASVLTERLLKDAAFTLWERNAQLSLCGAALGLAAVYGWEWELVVSYGFFHGYTRAVWVVVVLQSAGGFVTAAALKYSDSVMVRVSKALPVVIGSMLARMVFREGPVLCSAQFLGGMVPIILGATYYGLDDTQLLRCCGAVPDVGPGPGASAGSGAHVAGAGQCGKGDVGTGGAAQQTLFPTQSQAGVTVVDQQ